MRFVRPLLAAALVAPTAGCELIDQILAVEVPLPVPIETPAQEVNVTQRVADLEAEICSDAASEDCQVLQAIDRTDDDQVSSPPALPAEFPAEVDVDGDDATTEDKVNVEEWANEEGFFEAAHDLKVAVPVDLSSHVEEEQKDKIKKITIKSIGLNFQENSLTFATVPLDVYVSEGPVDSTDAEELLAQGLVKKVGTIEAQAAATTGERPITFVEGGNDIFNVAVKSLKFTMVATLPPGVTPALPKNEAGDKIIKPQGVAKVSLKGELELTISAAEVVDEAQAAAE